MNAQWYVVSVTASRVLAVEVDPWTAAIALDREQSVLLTSRVELEAIASSTARTLIVREQPLSPIRGYFPGTRASAGCAALAS